MGACNQLEGSVMYRDQDSFASIRIQLSCLGGMSYSVQDCTAVIQLVCVCFVCLVFLGAGTFLYLGEYKYVEVSCLHSAVSDLTCHSLLMTLCNCF